VHLVGFTIETYHDARPCKRSVVSVYGHHTSIAIEDAIVFFSPSKEFDRWCCKVFHYYFLSKLLSS